MYAQMDEKTGDALNISEPIPLPALNVSRLVKVVICFESVDAA